MAKPLISICIPSYERLQYLERLLESIKIQTFRDFEVIFTDDSKTENIKTFLLNYKADFPLHYYKNVPSLGTARNMLEGIKYANSNWIKIIHDDDFFVDETSLGQYAAAITTEALFVFSGYNEYLEGTNAFHDKTISQKKFKQIIERPSVLFADNLIGPPSVMMIHTSVKNTFDSKLTWFTDMEYYFRILSLGTSVYVNRPLVNISTNDTQVTSYTRTNPSVVIPEAMYLLNKHGKDIISNIIAYDAWWRVFRNFTIRSTDNIKRYAPEYPIPNFLKKLLSHQK
ncbi:MAG: glycosyltransferase family 2 protein, partial [Alphaproteobacteria bacterium]